MEKQFVKMEFDVFAEWNTHPPMYRVYVNDELFNERTYRWQSNEYITEILQIDAKPGEYNVRIENHGGEFTVRSLRCSVGKVKVINNSRFEIIEENASK
jgi:hypothetical protein